MPALMCSAPNMAVVAYGEVVADGTSTRRHSGVVTTHLALGTDDLFDILILHSTISPPFDAPA